MKKFCKLFLIPLISCCAFSLHAAEAVQTVEKKEASQEKKETPKPAEVERFTNAEKGYTIDYPSDWKKNDVPQLDLVLFAPSKENDGKPHASMNVVSEKVGAGITLDQFYSESETNLTSALKDVIVEKYGNRQLNGIPAKWIQYTHVMQGVKFRVLQYFIVSGESIFLLTFSTAADDFDKYRQDFENVSGSFKILNAKISTP